MEDEWVQERPKTEIPSRFSPNGLRKGQPTSRSDIDPGWIQRPREKSKGKLVPVTPNTGGLDLILRRPGILHVRPSALALIILPNRALRD